MSFAHVSLTQDGGVVTGRYHDWGYTYADLENAGTISGTVYENDFTGTFQDNSPGDPAVPLAWTLSTGQLIGMYQEAGQPPYPWCGVTAGQGTPLPTGCGWSDHFESPYNPSNGGGPVTLQQVADEVTGDWFQNSNGLPGKVAGSFFGVVSDFRVNGQYINTIGGSPGRFSFWMTPDGTQFAGNYFFRSQFGEWCGGRGSSNSLPPIPCLGGGGIYDGSWFTNLGVLTLMQPQPFTTAVTGVWFWWGGETEYAIAGLVSGPDAGPATAYSLSWTDSSPLGGAVGLTSLPSDPNSITLQGQTAVDGGGAWCGVNYGVNPFVPLLPDAGQIGTLYEGCGLTSTWNFSGTPTQLEEISGEMVQTRGSVVGSISPTGFLDMYSGNLAFNDAGIGSWLVVTGSWSLPDAGSGTFIWYPDADEQTFGGEYTENGQDAGAWCGSEGVSLPSPCLE
jgi:hypothetical protein